MKHLPVPEKNFRFARVEKNPIRAIAQRASVVLGLILFVALLTYFDRSGYQDAINKDGITFLDSLYYATVSITTTGYGDIVPTSFFARLTNIIIMTPARIIFVILLIGTTVEILASKTKFLYQLKRWQKKLNNHVVICGFGVKGQNALSYLRESGKDDFVVAIDTSAEALTRANFDGVNGIVGNASELEILRAARVDKAREVIVCPRDDDEAILIVLRIRELSKNIKIVASCREEKNVELLKSSGANQVIVSASSAGRLLGMAAEYPAAADMVNDLLIYGQGRDIQERDVYPEEIGQTRNRSETIVAIIRDGKQLKLNDPNIGQLRPDDRIVSIKE